MFPGNRQTSCDMKPKFSLALVLAGILLAADASAAEDWSGIVSHNITVRLTGVRRIHKEPFNLVARFVTDDRAAREFTVEFPDNPPDAHVATIMNVIEHAAAQGYGGKSEWRALNIDVLLSVPPNTQGVVTNFNKWGIFTVSVPDYPTAHWEGEAVPLGKVIEQSERIVVAKCISAGAIKASGLTSVALEVEHVITGANTNHEIAGETYGQLRPGKFYLICLGNKSGADAPTRQIISNGLLPITEASWSSDWDKLPPKEQITQVLATRVIQLRSNLEQAAVERERLKKILEASRPLPKSK